MSHLTTLICRVIADEKAFGYAEKEHLINLAEYILSWHDYSKQEEREAVALLAKYRLAKLANKHNKQRSLQLIQRELDASWQRRCARCGLTISSEKSLETGLGSVCRRKACVDAERLNAENLQRMRRLGLTEADCWRFADSFAGGGSN